ncbi:surfactant protein Ba isoform X2 [Cynoglossus semilaevis]|uniref:surfactant protein Ba isoform X2 n=1 Tax=Cynoglossus semilaevis TaxID=244447 RepID=UPI000D62A93F|nr:prosaposin-like isoform X2 [Cynoglossus semilaevis]
MNSLSHALLLLIALHGYCLASAQEELLFDVRAAAEQTSPGDQTSPGANHTGDICRDCTQILELLVNLMGDPDMMRKMLQDADFLCDQLPEKVVLFCKQGANTLLPVSIHVFTNLLNPEKACEILGVCSSSEEQDQIMGFLVEVARQAAERSRDGHLTTKCSICRFIVQKINMLLPKDKVEDAVICLLKKLCCFLPPVFQHTCITFTDTITRSVVDAVLSNFNPKTICELIRMCMKSDVVPAVPNACTLATYRCRDTRTALKCGTYFYCQRFVWKPTVYDMI